MVQTMGQFFGMGFTLEQVVAMVHRQSRARDRRGQPTAEASPWGARLISVLEVRDGRWVVYDTLRETR